MKYSIFIVILVLFFLNFSTAKSQNDTSNSTNFTHTNSTHNKTVDSIKEKKLKNQREFNHTIYDAIKKLNIKNTTTLTKMQFRELFELVFNKGVGNLTKQNDAKNNFTQNFMRQIFDKIVEKVDDKGIKVNEIAKFLNPAFIMDIFKQILNDKGLGKVVDMMNGKLSKKIEEITEKGRKNSSEKCDENSNKTCGNISENDVKDEKLDNKTVGDNTDNKENKDKSNEDL